MLKLAVTLLIPYLILTRLGGVTSLDPRVVLREPCRTCGKPVRTSWAACPYCASDRVPSRMQPAAPASDKRRCSNVRSCGAHPRVLGQQAAFKVSRVLMPHLPICHPAALPFSWVHSGARILAAKARAILT